MKKSIILTIGIVVLSLSTIAQETKNKNSELWMSARGSLINYSLSWKKQKSEKIFYKFSFLSLNASFDKNDQTGGFGKETYGVGGGLGIGIEFRKEITSRFIFFHGPDILFNASYSELILYNGPGMNEQKEILRNFTPGLHYNIGFIIPIRNNFHFAASISPGISIRKFDIMVGDNVGSSIIPSLNIDSQQASISLFYRFVKP